MLTSPGWELYTQYLYHLYIYLLEEITIKLKACSEW
jgi:hypothetical protein